MADRTPETGEKAPRDTTTPDGSTDTDSGTDDADASPFDPHAGVVSARGLTRTFGSDAGVQDLDLVVPEGCIFGLVGPSGSGKTTTVRLVLGLLEPDDGDVAVLGRSPSATDRTRIGYLPQDSVLYPDLTLRHNLNLVASLYGLPWRARFWPKGRRGKAARARINEVLQLVGLEEHTDTRLAQASGGEQRRLGLAAALVHRPDLLVLDEPTTGIDPVLRRRLWEHFTALRDGGQTLFITTQYVTEATSCDLVGLVVGGQVLHVGTPDELRRRAFGGDLVAVTLSRPPTAEERTALVATEGIHEVEGDADDNHLRVVCDDADRRTAAIVTWAGEHDLEVMSTRTEDPSFDDVFVALVADADKRQDVDTPLREVRA